MVYPKVAFLKGICVEHPGLQKFLGDPQHNNSAEVVELIKNEFGGFLDGRDQVFVSNDGSTYKDTFLVITFSRPDVYSSLAITNATDEFQYFFTPVPKE